MYHYTVFHDANDRMFGWQKSIVKSLFARKPRYTTTIADLVCRKESTYYFYNSIAEIHCGSLVAPTHGSASGSSDTVGSVVMFSCDAGFRLIGSSQRTCQQNGDWDGDDVTCDG